VHCSSVGVYGDLRDPPAHERTSCHPDTIYEKTKLAGERAVREYSQQSGFPTVIIRPSWVYGPGCPRTQKLFRSIQKGWFFYVGSGESMRHPIHIKDMVDAFETAATHPAAPGETFVIAGPQAVTINELATEIAAVLDARPPRLRLPKPLVWLGCSLVELSARSVGREAPFTRRSLKFFTGNSAFDTSKAERELGYKAVIELQEGLRKTAELGHEMDQSISPQRQSSRIASQ
jgi:nucleoside-diphosphate-sugar epimerase